MLCLRHPCIMPLLGTLRSQEQMLLTLPYTGDGALQQLLSSHGALPEGEARWPFRQLAAPLQYCHARGVSHLDLKPNNVLLDRDEGLLPADSGLSDDWTRGPMRGPCGTTAYMAPELKSGLCTTEVDIWSPGVVLFYMVTGKRPSELGPYEPGGFWQEHQLPSRLSPRLWHLLQGLLMEDPSGRLDRAAINTQPW